MDVILLGKVHGEKMKHENCPLCKEVPIDWPDQRVCSECMDILAEVMTRRIVKKILLELPHERY